MLGIMVVVILLFTLSLYNTLVDTRHNITQSAEDLQKAVGVNAESQNTLYAMLDSSHLQAVAEKAGLVKEKGPKFLEVNVSVVWPDSRF